MSDHKKAMFIVLSLLAFLSFGCLELTAVPGISVSPDGSMIYFLEGSFMNAESSMGILTSVDLSTGQKEVIMAADSTALVTAFDVNQANGDLAYVYSTEEPAETKIVLYNVAAGARDLVTGGTLPAGSVGTMMQFSPDGSMLAVSILTVGADFAGGDIMNFSTDSGDAALTPEQLSALHSTLYIVDTNSGEAKQVSNPDTQWASTLSWNPSGTQLAYNSWVDSDGDGMISSLSFLAGMQTGGTGDMGEIHIYDVASGSDTTVPDTAIGYSPEFVSDTQVAYIAVDMMGAMMGGSGFTIKLYDQATSAVTAVHESKGMILGLALSPDGSRVAWTETGEMDTASAMSDDGSATESSPNFVFASDPAFSAPSQVTQLMDEGMIMVDVPVWMPDGSSVLVGSTNIFGSMMGMMGDAMGGIATSLGGDAEDMQDLPTQKIFKVDMSSGESTVVYSGSMTNSSFMAGLISTATSNLEDMGQ